MVILRVGDYSQGVDLRHQNLGRNHIELDVDKERGENLNALLSTAGFLTLHLNQRFFGTPECLLLHMSAAFGITWTLLL